MKANRVVGPGRASATPSKPYQLPDDLAPWVAQALSDERWFGDGPPNWKYQEPSDARIAERKRRVRQIEKYSKGTPPGFLERLENCVSGDRCGLGCCPECNTALQRFFVNQATSLVRRQSDELWVCSAVLEIAQYNDLAQLDLEKTNRALKRVFEKSNVRFALGGFDISLNIDLDAQIPTHWALQAWFVTSGRPHELNVRRRFKPKYAYRPVVFLPFDGNPSGWAYALKSDFDRRENYHEAKYRNGILRLHQNKRHTPLQVIERNRLWSFLAREGLGNRLIQLGVRPTMTARGIELVKLSYDRGSVRPDKDLR